jgi:hypothetical protein
LQTDSDGWRNINADQALGNILAETMLQNYTNEAYVRNNVALDDVSASRIVVWTQLEWKEPSWVGIEYSDGASGLYAPCRAMRICPFKRIRYEDFDTLTI